MHKPGLPDHFDLDVPEKGQAAPVRLGTYLEEDAAPITPQPAAAVAEAVTETAKVLTMPHVMAEPPTPAPPPEDLPSKLPVVTRSRAQVNLSHRVRGLLGQLQQHVRDYSVQHDTHASEVVEALAEAAVESLPHLDLSGLPPRGRWGSPNAAAFKTTLKNAFRMAIFHHVDSYQQPNVDE